MSAMKKISSSLLAQLCMLLALYFVCMNRRTHLRAPGFLWREAWKLCLSICYMIPKNQEMWCRDYFTTCSCSLGVKSWSAFSNLLLFGKVQTLSWFSARKTELRATFLLPKECVEGEEGGGGLKIAALSKFLAGKPHAYCTRPPVMFTYSPC